MVSQERRIYDENPTRSRFTGDRLTGGTRLEALFLDRDGVLNVNRVDHVTSWDQFRFIPGSLDALRRLRIVGIPVIVVTNQAIIGRGITPVETVETIHKQLRHAVEWAGGAITDVLYCPHRPEEDCQCRKPRPGLLLEAARRHGLDLRRCAIVGDAYSDISAGLEVGSTALMVQTGRGIAEHQAAQASKRDGYRFVADLAEAVDILLSHPQLAGIPIPVESGDGLTQTYLGSELTS